MHTFVFLYDTHQYEAILLQKTQSCNYLYKIFSVIFSIYFNFHKQGGLLKEKSPFFLSSEPGAAFAVLHQHGFAGDDGGIVHHNIKVAGSIVIAAQRQIPAEADVEGMDIEDVSPQ